MVRTKTDYIIQLIHHHVTFNFNPGDACKRCRFCVSTLQRFPQQWLVLASVSLENSLCAVS